MSFRRVPFSHTPNARDLGGYATKNGVTRFNVFFRSACLQDFDAADQALAKRLNLGAVIDLRGGANTDERLSAACVDGVARYNFALGDGAIPYFAKDVPQSYMDMLQSTDSLKSIFTLLADESCAVLFHCFAGKDRTGVVAALLLMLAGVSDEDIVADYCLTYPYFLKRLRSDFLRRDAEKYVFVPIPEHMEGFLKLFRQKYGSVNAFLQSIGVGGELQQKIVDKFVEKY